MTVTVVRQRRGEELRRGEGAARRLVRARSGTAQRAGRPQRRRQDHADQADAGTDPRRSRRDPRAGRGSGGRRILGAPAARLSAGECRVQRRADRARDAGILRAAEADQAGLGMAAARPRRPDAMPPIAGSGPIPRACGSGSAWPRRCSGRPRVLLLDEPTTGLDPALRQTFYEILNELRDDGATVLISSHALNELEDRAEHVLIMNRGRAGRAGHAGGTALDLATADPGLARSRTRRQRRPAGLDERGERRDARTAASCWCPTRPARWSCCASQPAIPASRNIEIAAPTLDDLYAHFLAGECRVRNIVIIAGQGNQGRAAQSLGSGDHAAAGGAVAVPDLPRQRADRQCRRRRARCGRRQPVQPDDLSAAADRAADFARRGGRRDGARHHDPAAQLSGRPLPGHARKVLRPCR